MKEQTKSAIKLLEALTERAKELTCLYAVEEILRTPDADVKEVCERIVQAVPPGWQFPEICVTKIFLEGREYGPGDFEETPWKLSATICQQENPVGTITVYYTREMPAADIGPFLNEEKKLIETIADRLNHYLTYKKMKHLFQEYRVGVRENSDSRRGDWEAVLDLIRQTDHALFLRISNKMLNHLCWSGIEEAEELRKADETREIAGGIPFENGAKGGRLNRLLDFSTEFTERIYWIAANHLSSEEILSRIQMWIQEDKLGTLLRTVRRRLPLAEVSSALLRYFFTTREETCNRYPLARGLKVLLIECILSSRLDYIDRAKEYVDIEDLYHLLQKVVYSADSHGKLGGKSAGLFLASRILDKTGTGAGSVGQLIVPKTWYLSSDMMLEFIHYNNMDEIIEQKYKDIERVRLEYRHVIDMFRQTVFPPEIVNKLSAVLDDFGDRPVVVRSSSLLEDRTGCTFIGDYKSVFLGNRGDREKRLGDLMRAIAEIYASNFGPEPIERRAEFGLLELSEQMGIMIQEVVGKRVGKYFLPVYSGIARSRNEFRWSREIKGEDGVIRLMPGLGTRSPNGTGEEHPVLVVPGRPALEVNGTVEDRIRRAPKKIDVINLETNELETLDMGEFIEQFGDEYPQAELVVSGQKNGQICALERGAKLKKSDVVVTFEGLITRSPFVPQIREVLETLEGKLGRPVEIEFAADGENVYLLQQRNQSLSRVPRPAPIPKDLERRDVVFSANRYVSNGKVTNITHVVYLDQAAYEGLYEPEHRRDVELALRDLNKLLPKRQFLIMLPGRLSVEGNGGGVGEINYSQYNNAAVLVEMLKPGSTGDSALSVGVNFLQDIVEADISYLPVFPDDEDTVFNRRFLMGAQNLLPELLPRYEHVGGALRVIDVPGAAGGKTLQVLMNAELGEAVGLLAAAGSDLEAPSEEEIFDNGHPENYWRWRQRMAEKIAAHLDPAGYGVQGIYVFGSTKNGTAGPASDIDILIHFRGSDAQREKLNQWLEGWSLCLDEINYLRTGYRSGGLLDCHIVTDEDIKRKSSYAVKINAVTDAARPLKMKESDKNPARVSGKRGRRSGNGAR